MKRVILILAAVLSTAVLTAKEGDLPVASDKDQTCEVKGQIIDKINGEILTGVAVKLAGSDKVTYTNFDGEFSFDNLTPGTYTIETAMVSYKGEQVVVEADSNSERELEIAMETITE